MLPFRNTKIVTTSLKPNADKLGRRVVTGAFWTFGAMIIRVVLTIFSTAVLARLLTPEDFGLIAMSSLITELAALLGNIGVNYVIIQKAHLKRSDLDTSFWITLILDGGLCMLVIALSFFADDFFHSPRIREILWGSSFLFILGGLSSIHTSLLNRQLMFREDAFIQLNMLMGRIAVSIGLAQLGWGVWSLVIGSIAGQTLATLWAWHIVPFIPRFRFERGFFSQHWRSGGSILGSGILTYLMSNIDYWVIARRFGATELGYYQIAFSLPEELRNRLSGPIVRLLFPAYSRIQDNNHAFQQGVFRSLRVLSTIAMPIGFGMAIVADDLIRVLYGEQWKAVIPLLQILAIGGLIRALTTLLGPIFSAKGRPDLAFKIQMLTTPYMLGAIILGSEWGIVGVAWAMLAALIPNSMITVHFASSLIGRKSGSLYRQIVDPFASSLIMCSVLESSHIALTLTQFPPLLRLFFLAALGFTVYMTSMILISKQWMLEVLSLFFKRH